MRRIRKLFQDKLAVLGLFMIFILTIISLFPSVFATHDPLDMNLKDRFLVPGSRGHIFGTDERGRDIWSRIIYGSSLSMRSGGLAILIALAIGIMVGSAAGYGRSFVDEVLMRICDVFMSFPPLVLAMAIVALLGPGLNNSILAISIVWWPRYARLVRAQFMYLREQSYVEAARALGATDIRIIFCHLLPNSVSPIVVQGTIDVGYAILYTSALSFIGLGATPPTPEWGSMVAAGRSYLLDYWWISTMPGFAVFFVVLAYNIVGDALRDLLDPRSILL